MVARDRQAFHTGINNYVPAMAYDAYMAHGQPGQFSLGSPAAVSANNIAAAVDADAVATTQENYAVTLDGRYGRTIRVTVSGDPGAAGGVLDVFGVDYLGQPMVERFTGANGATAILYGKKAFYRITHTKIVTATTNAVTYAIGTGYRFGLPYKGDIDWVKENGILVPLFKRDMTIWGSLSDADVTAGTSIMWAAQFPGFIKRLIGLPSGAGSTTNAAATVEIATVAVTGLTVTVDQDTQTLVEDAPTTVGYNANNRFVKDSVLEIVHAATTNGGPVSYGLELTPTQFTLPITTDPQTNVTGDPRGTYEPITAPAGFEIIVGLVGDSEINATGNGGLHGIRHVNA